METAEHSIIIHHHFNHHYEISTGILWVESCVLNPTMSLKSSIRRVVQTKNWRKFWQGILHDWDTFGDMIMENTACKIRILCAQVSISFGPWWIQSRSFDQMMKFSPGFPQITETTQKNEAFIKVFCLSDRSHHLMIRPVPVLSLQPQNRITYLSPSTYFRAKEFTRVGVSTRDKTAWMCLRQCSNTK